MKIDRDYESQLRKEWYEEQNGYSFDVGLRTPDKNAYWKCKDNHTWNARIISRVKRKSRCPYCAGRKAIKGQNDVATLYPELVKQFHPLKNGELKLDMFKESSAKKIWWLCDKGHEWEAVIFSRTKLKYGCPVCSSQKTVAGINDFRTLYPDIASEISPEGNEGIDLDVISCMSKLKIVWVCPRGHHYDAAVDKRTSRGAGCPYCAGKRPISGENDLGTVHPEVQKFWDIGKNGSIENYARSSSKKVNWKCENGHEWVNSIINQVNSNKCPYCEGRYLIIGKNDVATIYPQLVQEWDSEANGLEPSEVKANMHTYAFWKCQKGHSWRTNIGNRVKGKGCPYCSGNYPIKGENDLATLFPWLVKEWDYKLNRKSPDEYLSRSNIRVWWKCENNHSWKALISERTRGTGCPQCRRNST